MDPRNAFRDFDWYAERMLFIKPAEGGEVTPFTCRPIQAALNRFLDSDQTKPRKILVLKSRRMGVSSFISAKFTHIACTNAHIRAVVAAHTGPDAANIFGIYERFYKLMPDFWEGIPVKPERRGGTGQSLDFSKIDSRIDVSSALQEPRGGDVQYLHLSEVAYYPDPERYLGALLPSFPITGRGILVLESTSDGPAGFYKDQWDAAVDGVSGYEPFFFGWHEDPTFRLFPGLPREEWSDEEVELSRRYGCDGEQLAWYRDVLYTQCFGSIKRRRIEYPSSPEEAFTNILGTVWERSDLLPCLELAEPVWSGTVGKQGLIPHREGDLLIWEQPVDKSERYFDYVIGADVGGGLADSDLNVASVWKVPRRGMNGWPVQVAEMSCRQDVVTWGYTLAIIGTHYNRALISAEVTGLGRGTQATLMKCYHRLHRWVPWDKYRSTSDTWGWETTWKSKQIMVGLWDWLIKSRRLTIQSKELNEELLFFRQTGPEQYEGARGDDRVIAAMIAVCSWYQHMNPNVGLADLRATLARLHGAMPRAQEDVADDLVKMFKRSGQQRNASFERW